MTDGPLFDALDAARKMLAACHYWQAAVEAQTDGILQSLYPAAFPNPFADLAEESLARIFLDELPQSETAADHIKAELEALRPFALIWNDLSRGLSIQTDTGGNCAASVEGMVVIQIELPTPAATAGQPNSRGEAINKAVGRILRSGDESKPGLWELSGQADYLPLLDTQITGYIRTNTKEQQELGDAVMCEIICHWGVQR